MMSISKAGELELRVEETLGSDVPVVENRMATRTLKIHRSAKAGSGRRGTIYTGQVFASTPTKSIKGCQAGWAAVKGGFVCLEHTKVTALHPQALPIPLRINPPEGDEALPILPSSSDPPFATALHARRLEGDRGRMWASVDAFVTGERANWKLEEGREYRFVDAVKTNRGWVLVRPNRKVVPLDEVTLYSVSRFQGWDLQADPIEPELVLGWVLEETILHMAPDGDEIESLSFQTAVSVLDRDPESEWVGVMVGDGYGYVRREDLRIWTPSVIPEELSNDDRWIDVNLDQQILTVYDGDEPIFVTLISSAKQGYVTPTGLFRIYDKATGWDLASLPEASDPYFMERVPFVMHYFPRYALHSAFWHDEFGRPASHGCINLSMKDAETVFDLVDPELPDGWSYVRQRPTLPGTVVQIRAEGKSLPDRRILK